MSALPLEGLTIFELGGSASAPYAGLVLSELGADVIKVERPGAGDDARSWGPPFAEGAAVLFHAFNRNKRSITVDYEDPAQRAALVKLIVEKGDAVVQNLRPGLVRRFGLDAETLQRLKPELVYCNIHAYGQDGPMKDHPGYDPIIQAFCGIMSITGENERPPVRVGMSILDITTGIWAAMGVLAAITGKLRGRPARQVDASLLETGLGFMQVQVATVTAGAAVPGRYGSGHPMIVPNKAFQARDGWFLMTAGNDRLFNRFAEIVGRPEWVSDPKYATNSARVKNQAELYALIEPLLLSHDVAWWVDRLVSAGIPTAPIYSVDKVIAHPQTQATGIVQQAPGGAMSLVGLPVMLDGRRRGLDHVAPGLGNAGTGGRLEAAAAAA